jgi:hypothetical protein
VLYLRCLISPDVVHGSRYVPETHALIPPQLDITQTGHELVFRGRSGKWPAYPFPPSSLTIRCSLEDQPLRKTSTTRSKIRFALALCAPGACAPRWRPASASSTPSTWNKGRRTLRARGACSFGDKVRDMRMCGAGR